MLYGSSLKARRQSGKRIEIGKSWQAVAYEVEMVRIEVLFQPEEHTALKAAISVLDMSMRHVARALILNWTGILKDSRIGDGLMLKP